MARVLGIMGSPRTHGNTHTLMERVLAGAHSAGAETELVFLGDLTIHDCIGCHVCWQGDRCAVKDGMSELYPKIAAADALVFGTPVYWYACSGLMKLFIDRLVYFNCDSHRPGIRGTRAALVVPYEETAEETVRPVLDFFDACFSYLELVPAGRLIVPGVTKRGEVVEKEDVMQRAEEMGREML